MSTPIVVRLVSTFWSNMDPAMGEAASMLGASPRRVFLTVTAPLLAPAIAAAAALIFLFTFTSFGIILILGAPEHATLEVEIYSLMTKLFRPQLAAALALTQLIATFGMLWAYVRLQSAAVSRIRLRAQGVAATASTRSPMDYMMLIGAFAAVFLVLSPPLALLVRSFITPDGLGLDGYAAIMSNDRNEYFYISPVWGDTQLAGIRVRDSRAGRAAGCVGGIRAAESPRVVAQSAGRPLHAAPRCLSRHARPRLPAKPASGRIRRPHDESCQ